MTLAGETREFLVWLNQTVRVFSRTDAFLTWGVIIATVGARLCNLLAFILPLKIILLVGSDGVPRYFRGFITEDTQVHWIVGLSVGAVALYLLSVALEAMAKRKAMVGSGKVLGEANTLVLMHNQDGVAQGYYSRCCGAYASVLFAMVLLTIGLWLHPPLYLFVIGLIAVEFLLSTVAMGRLESRERSALAKYLAKGSGNFLSILSSVNFLLVFGWLLADFLIFETGNVLVAIVSIMIARQLFGNVVAFVAEGIWLHAERTRINALIRKGHHVQRQETNESQQVRWLLEPSKRVKRAAEVLDISADRLVSRWADKSVRGVATFELTVDDASTPSFCEIVYFPSSAYLVENEDILFQHVDAAQLRRPRLVGQYETEGFVGRIYDFEQGKPVELSSWPDERKKLLAHSWGVRPERDLKDVYRASKPLIHERFTDELIERIEVAVDEDVDEQAYALFRADAEKFRRILRDMPLFIYNPEISSEIVVITPANEERVMRWGQWSLEPVGVGMEPRVGEILWLSAAYPEMVSAGQIPAEVTFEDILAVSRLWYMERLITRGRMKAAVKLIPQLLAAACVSHPTSADRLADQWTGSRKAR